MSSELHLFDRFSQILHWSPKYYIVIASQPQWKRSWRLSEIMHTRSWSQCPADRKYSIRNGFLYMQLLLLFCHHHYNHFLIASGRYVLGLTWPRSCDHPCGTKGRKMESHSLSDLENGLPQAYWALFPEEGTMPGKQEQHLFTTVPLSTIWPTPWIFFFLRSLNLCKLVNVFWCQNLNCGLLTSAGSF